VKYFFLIVFTTLCIVDSVKGQDTPQDFLSSEFHKSKRDELRNLMPKNTVAVFFANPVRNRANDVDFVYHQDPDFYYLTGYREPNAVLLVFSDDQTNSKDEKYDELIYVQKRDPRAEQWNGKRLGVEGVKSTLGFDNVFNGEAFENAEIDFSSFESVLFFDFNSDVRDTNDDADLFSLIKSFKIKTNYPSDYNPTKKAIYTAIASVKENEEELLKQQVVNFLDLNPELKSDENIKAFLASNDEASKKELKERILSLSSNNLDSQTLNGIMSIMRETKTKEELKLLKKAIEISAVGQVEIMKAMHPDMSETEIQGVHEFVYKKYGAEYEGYPSIVGGGHNGCILHYIDNNKPEVGNKDLVLMDLGAEYHGYTADVTRTIPANGKFSEAQKTIYNIVYDAQEAGIRASVIGASFFALERAARGIVTKRLIALGIAKNERDARKYFPHGTSHYLGLDVHDKGTYGAFKENTVITVEPGIYIPEGSDCDKKWWGIAVRIEDDILITKDGPVNLSEIAPRKVEEIEKMMTLESPLSNFSLPDLDRKN